VTLSLKQAIDALNGRHAESVIGAFNINGLACINTPRAEEPA
jgi:hypothetical protein